MDQEYSQLKDEIDRIVIATNFNTIKLLDSNATGMSRGSSIFVDMGTGASFTGDDVWCDANGKKDVDSIAIKYNAVNMAHMTMTGSNIASASSAQHAITEIDYCIKQVSEMRADIGAYVNRLETTVNNLVVSAANQQAAESQIRDVDFAYQSSSFTKNQILTQSATAMLSQANAGTQSVLSLLR